MSLMFLFKKHSTLQGGIFGFGFGSLLFVDLVLGSDFVLGCFVAGLFIDCISHPVPSTFCLII